MPENKLVGELMVPISEYPVVYDNEIIEVAIKVLKEHYLQGKEHRSLLVFSKSSKIQDEERLVGILTIRDILNAIKINTIGYNLNNLYEKTWKVYFRHRPLKESTSYNIRDVPVPLVDVYIQSGENVIKAVSLMMTRNVNLLPVFEKQKVVGVLRAIDILDYIGEML